MAQVQLNTTVYQAIADLNLWIKLQSGTNGLTLADVPTIISSQWTYIRDNWLLTIQPAVQALVPSYANPDFLNQQIAEFTNFVAIQISSNINGNPFNNSSEFYKFYTVFDNILLNSIKLTNQNQTVVNNIVSNVQDYSQNDFENIKTIVMQARDSYADYIGLTDASYNAAFSRSAIAAQISPSIVNINQLLVYQNTVNSIDFILSNLSQVDAVLDHFALARQNANNPLISIGQYSSGYMAKINYGESLEALAQRILGDPARWLDIAIANGLKEPYIDEVGIAIPLVSNGNGNQINVTAINSNGEDNINLLYINQIVILQSSTQLFVDQRTITNLKVIPVSGDIVITLSGANNLDIYKLADNASIRVFAADTINSKFMILIPSQDPLPSNRVEEVPWFLASSAQDIKNCGIDLAISANGDLMFDSTADLELSYGLNNGVQAIQNKLQTELGELRYHPLYGIVNLVGSKNSQAAQIQQLLSDSIVQSINSDPRFNRVTAITVVPLTGGAATGYSVNLVVQLAGGSSVLVPISFSIIT